MKIESVNSIDEDEGYFLINIDGQVDMCIPWWDYFTWESERNPELKEYADKFETWKLLVDDLLELSYPFETKLVEFLRGTKSLLHAEPPGYYDLSPQDFAYQTKYLRNLYENIKKDA